MLNKPKKYILRNISKNDVNLGDLKYTIPAGQARDLLGRNAHLEYEDILKSRQSGSISKRLGRSLIEVNQIIIPVPPAPKVAVEQEPIVFPQRTKSFITIEVGDIEESAQSVIENEDEEFLKELELRKEIEGVSPIVASDEEKEKK